MVIIVFRREEQMIDEPHRLLQPRVQHRTAEGVGRQRADAIQQPPARRAELGEELPDIARVVIRFVGLAVAQVGGGQRVAACDEVVHPRRPERLEIKQMAGVLLRGPFVAGLAHQDVAWNAAHDLLQPCGRAAEPDAEVGILVDGERELECAFEPGGDVAHPFSLVVSLRAALTGIDTIDRASTLSPMAMGKRKRHAKQDSMWVATQDLRRSAAHPFYARLNQILDQHAFDRYVERLCERFYADDGRPGLPPGRYFRLLLIGYFEGLDAERAIAWRAADSFALREFLRLVLPEAPPDHSTISRTRRLIDLETHEAVFTWMLQRLADAGLVEDWLLTPPK